MSKLRIQTWSLGRVAREMDGELTGAGVAPQSPAGVSTDSRTIDDGELFVALNGERFDGHDFVEDAVGSGARAVAVEDASAAAGTGVPVIVVDDCFEALGRLGHAVFRAGRQEGLHSMAVTGSNGKTTTKELLAAIWGVDGEVWATPGNLNNHIGVPLTLCALPLECDHLVVEMGANHRGEISELVELAPADQRIVTSIGRAHLEGFGSMAGIRKAKAEIFEQSGRATTAVVPRQERSELISSDYHGNVLTFGEEYDAEVVVESTEVVDRDGQIVMETRIRVAGENKQFSLPIVGRHNASNLAAALATVYGAHAQLDDEAVGRALRDLELPGGRFRVVTLGDLQILDDAYNANPSSMRASYRAFEQWCEQAGAPRKIAVIGDMHELGEEADNAHRRLAEWLVDRPGLSGVAFVGEFAPMMADAAQGGPVDEVVVLRDHDRAADWLADAGPARVFVKGSRGNELEQIIERLE